MARDPDGVHPPGPRGHWLVGNLRAYEDDRLGFLLTARQKYGDVAAFDNRTAIVNSGRLAREMLLDRHHAFDLHEDFLQRRWTPEALEESIVLRRHLNPGLRTGAAVGIAPSLARRIDQGAAAWTDAGGGPRNPMGMLERAITESVAEYYFSEDGEALVPLLTDLLDALSRTILDPFVLPWHSLSPARREIRRRHRVVAARVTALLEARIDRPVHDDFAAMIVGQAAGEATPSRLADMVIGSMLAGQRVPAAAASWLLMLVAEAPHLAGALGSEARVLDELLARGAGGDISLRELPLATACVLETLRLYPTTWLITRRASRPVEVGGYRFAAGHHFMLSPYVIHRDEREFPDPEAFVPERWTASVIPSGTYLPFGHGQHICPGRRMATLALVVVLLRTLARGQLARCPGPVVPNPRNTLVPDGLRLTLQAQTSQVPTQFPPGVALPVAG
jgi:cytochrome P450